QVLDAAVRADEHGLLGELRPDRLRGVEAAGAVRELELGAVGKENLHETKDTCGSLDTCRYIGNLSRYAQERSLPLLQHPRPRARRAAVGHGPGRVRPRPALLPSPAA